MTVIESLVRAGWETRAACAGSTTLFFSAAPQDVERAKGICRACPVREPCLALGLEAAWMTGVMGATTEQERRDMRRESWETSHSGAFRGRMREDAPVKTRKRKAAVAQ
jgi:hypothetical protein